ncbi:mitochondrial large subunit ribosomal protein-domain-containing protein [Phyllosticta capitalensis]
MFRLPFLFRASVAPKPATTASIARFSQCARLRSEAAAVEHESQTVAPKTRPRLPYFVMRTPSAKLPVYHETKAGGNLHQTKLRKIEGDIRKLKSAIQTELGLDPSEVKINDVTRNILIKGNRKMEIQDWLIEKGF